MDCNRRIIFYSRLILIAWNYNVRYVTNQAKMLLTKNYLTFSPKLPIFFIMMV